MVNIEKDILKENIYVFKLKAAPVPKNNICLGFWQHFTVETMFSKKKNNEHNKIL